MVKIPDKPKTSEAQNKSPIIMNIGDNMTALTDTNITIQCHASGAPKPTVTWLKNGQKIRIDSKYAVQDDGSLIIRGTDKGDTARYSCIAESATGKDSASSVVMVAGELNIIGISLQLVTRTCYRVIPVMHHLDLQTFVGFDLFGSRNHWDPGLANETY